MGVKKITHFLEVLEPIGGTSIKLRALVRETRGILEHTFVCIDGSKMTDDFAHIGAKVYELKTRSIPKLMRKYAEIIDVVRPDVLATHFSRSFLVGSLVNLKRKLPHIHFEHGPANLKPKRTRLITRILVRYPDRIVCNSEFTRRTFETCFGPIGNKARVIYNPVEPRDTPGSVEVSETIIGHVGGLVRWRDQQTLLRAFKMLIEYKDNNRLPRLVIIGDGPEKDNLTRLAEELDIVRYIEFRGYQTDIGPALKSFSMYVNPAREEGFGIANVEAMLSGVPVILSNAGAHVEQIVHETTGLHFEVGNPQSLFFCMRQLDENNVLREALAIEGRRHAETSFCASKYAKSISGLVDELCIDQEF